MKSQAMKEIAVFGVLVFLGVAVRLAFRDLPNFAPVAAIALFSGYYFRSRALAVAVPLLVMAASDFVIGSYSWQMMALVYGCLGLPALLGGPLRRLLSLENPERSGLASTMGLVGCSLGMSLVFFVVTNFGAWLWFGTYERSLGGLGYCYFQALPFFRYTLSGDLVFGCLLFGSYATAISLVPKSESAYSTNA